MNVTETKEQPFYPGTRVKVFNTRVYRDDVTTPLSMTMQPATVIAWYGRRSWHEEWIYPSMIDVQFDSDPRVSHGHFTEFVEVLS